ncbi:MAG TPA: hypothetical protein VK766_08340 [Cytophagaceae bacterium]|nr:hypothetical protein [Cytophagaceae bacterium]
MPNKKVTKEVCPGMDTDLLKEKLREENLAVLQLSEELKLPTERENAWLNKVYDYQNRCKEAGSTSVYNFIGKPDFQDLSKIHPEKVDLALNDLIGKLYCAGIDVIYNENCYAAKTIYKFITEKLFQEEIYLYPEPGKLGYRLFRYEDFIIDKDE